MDLKKLWNIYKENVSGDWQNAIETSWGPGIEGSIGKALSLVLLIPYTLVITPFVCFSDYYHRQNGLSPQQKDALIDQIQQIGPSTIAPLTRHLGGSTWLDGPSSYQSIQLVGSLGKEIREAQALLKTLKENKRKELQLYEIPDPNRALKAYVEILKAPIEEMHLQKQKQLLIAYLGAEQNRGKKTPRRLWEFFFIKEIPVRPLVLERSGPTSPRRC